MAIRTTQIRSETPFRISMMRLDEALVHLCRFELSFGGQPVNQSGNKLIIQTPIKGSTDRTVFEGSAELIGQLRIACDLVAGGFSPVRAALYVFTQNLELATEVSNNMDTSDAYNWLSLALTPTF